jgi:hypothetical protein
LNDHKSQEASPLDASFILGGALMRQIRRPEEQISLPPGVFLIVRDLLNRLFHSQSTSGAGDRAMYDLSIRIDEAERRALHFLVGAIERSIHDSMTDEVPNLIAKEKQWIMSLPR